MKNDELAVSNENNDLAVYKSMFYQMNAKPDSMLKAFPQKIIICKEDIIDLNERIKEKIKLNYEDDGYIATVTVNLKNKNVITFTCWEEFIQHNWTETSYIVSISMQWNFNIRIAGYSMPQNHNLVVKLTNGLRPEEMLNFIFSGNLEDFDEIEMNAFPVIARVDFIQSLLGEELLNIVGKWVDGLKPNNDIKNPILLIMKKYRKKVAQYFEYVCLIMTTILLIGVENYFVRDCLRVESFQHFTGEQLNKVIIFFTICMLFIYLSKKFFEKRAYSIYERLSQYGSVYIFNITRGDQKVQSDILNKDKMNGKKILTKFFLSLVFNVACGVIASLLLGGN